MKLCYLIIINLALASNSKAQNAKDSLELLLINKWTIENTMKSEDYKPLNSSKMTIEFTQNHLYKANFSGQAESGIWELNVANKTIQLKEEKSKEFLKFDLIQLSSSKCIFRLIKKNGNMELVLTK